MLEPNSLEASCGFRLTRATEKGTAMRRRSLVQKTVLLPLLLALGGCAVPAADITPIQPLESAASIDYRVIYINVESSAPSDLTKDVAEIAFQLSERIRELNAVPQVIQSDHSQVADNELLIRLTISNLRKVGWVKQFFLGVFAGKASMSSTAEFVDGNTNELIGSYELRGEGPGTGNAIWLTIEAVVDLLKENYGISGG